MANPAAKSLYEGLFLISQAAAADMNAAIEQVRQILTRSDAEIIILQKWEERRLAYPIKGQRRGTYIIAYFNAPHSKLDHLDRDCKLSELILRSLILRADHIGDIELEMLKKGTLTFVEKKPEPEAPARKGSPSIDVPDLEEIDA
jgi:small subunit ribosomal protein S6